MAATHSLEYAAIAVIKSVTVIAFSTYAARAAATHHTTHSANEEMANADTRPVPALIMYGAKLQATWPGKVAVLPE